MTLASVRSSYTRATVPLQWPLVGRHEELELFVGHARRPTGTRIRHPRRGRRRQDPAGRPVPGAGRRQRSQRGPGDGDGGLTVDPARGAGPPAAARHRRRAVRSGDRDVGGPPGAAWPRRSTVRSCCSSTISISWTRRRRRSSASSSTPTSCSSCPRSAATRRCRRGWSRCGIGPASGASISRTSIGLRSTRCCTSCCAVRSRRPRSPRSGRPAAGNVLFVRELVLGAIDGGHSSISTASGGSSVRSSTTPRLHEVVATRLGALPPAAAEALDRLAVWEPTGLSPLEDARRPRPARAARPGRAVDGSRSTVAARR